MRNPSLAPSEIAGHACFCSFRFHEKAPRYQPSSNLLPSICAPSFRAERGVVSREARIQSRSSEASRRTLFWHPRVQLIATLPFTNDWALILSCQAPCPSGSAVSGSAASFSSASEAWRKTHSQVSVRRIPATSGSDGLQY